MDKEHIKILLVEDDPDDVWVMRNLLGDRWDGPFELAQVELLSAGIERLAGEPFDVILLDLSLPDSRGMETFFGMRAQAGDTPIVVLSGYDDERTAIKAVQAGAQDYLVKGKVDDNVLVRSIRYAIERSRRHSAEEELRDTSEEFRAAQEIQQRLYPNRAPTMPGFDIAGSVYPAKAAAGDYFDFIPMLNEGMGIVVGDVSSHGMGPALLMSETRACLRALAQVYSDVGEMLTRANRVLFADTADFHFVTLALARLSAHNREMVYASAGQRGYLLDATGEGATVLDSTALPLGVQAETVVPAGPPITLESGQILVFFTDGVVEAESPGRVRFGTHRALDIIRNERSKPAKEIVTTLYQEICGFCWNQPQRDDITIVIVKVLEV